MKYKSYLRNHLNIFKTGGRQIKFEVTCYKSKCNNLLLCYICASPETLTLRLAP